MYHVVFKVEDNLVYETHKELHEIVLMEKKVDSIVKIFSTHEGLNNKKYKSKYHSLTDKSLIILTNENAGLSFRPNAKVVSIEPYWERTLTESEVKNSKAIIRALDFDKNGMLFGDFIERKIHKIIFSLENYLDVLIEKYNQLGEEVFNKKKHLIDVINKAPSEVSSVDYLDEITTEVIFEKTKEMVKIIDDIERKEQLIGEEIYSVMETLSDLKAKMENKYIKLENKKLKELVFN